MTIQRVLAMVLIALTPIHWWALVVIVRAIRRNPEIHALRAQFARLALTGGAALALAIVSANFLLRGPLPAGAGFALLILTLLLISGPPAAFLFDYYRPPAIRRMPGPGPAPQETSMHDLADLFERTWSDLAATVACRRHHPHPKPPPGPVGPPAAPLITVRLVNRSRVATDAEVAAAAVDLQTQVSHDFAPAWLIDAAIVAGGTLQPGEWPLLIEDDAPQTGILGYHEEVAGLPTGHVYVRTAASFSVSWTSVASHELLEMLGDPRTVLAGIDDPTGTGTRGRILMAEACDAVEQSTYHVGGTEVSDFCTPAWWDRTSTGPFDHLGLLSSAFELLPGGSYIGLIRFQSQNGWEQQTAEKAPASEPAQPQ